MKYEGRFLVLGIIDKCNIKFSENCIVDYPNKVPVTFEFRDGLDNVLGYVKVSRNRECLRCNVTLQNEHFTDNSYFVGGCYDHVTAHEEDDITVIDSCRLLSIGITQNPADVRLKIFRQRED